MLHRACIIIFLLLMGCTTIQPQFVDPTGRLLPNPSYRMQGTSYPISMVFYYSAFEEIKDVDGTVIGVPKYLNFLTKQDIFMKKVKAITLTVEINNPSRLEYSLYEQTKVEGKKVNDIVQMGGFVNRSNLQYRQFVFNLPYGKDVRNVDHSITLSIDGNRIFCIGHFQYHLIN